MRLLAVGPWLGLSIAAALLAAACATPTLPASPTLSPGATLPESITGTSPAGAPAPPTGASAPAAITGAPGAGAAPTPGDQVLGARGAPGAAGTTAVVMVQALMNSLDQLSSRLQTLAAGSPAPGDLADMANRGVSLMATLSLALPQMSPQQRQQTLGKMSDVMGLMEQVVRAHDRQYRSLGAPRAVLATPTAPPGGQGGNAGTPGPTGGGSRGTPVPGAAAAQQMMTQMDQLRQQMMGIARNQPTHADLIDGISQMQRMFATLAQQASSLSPRDLRGLVADMAQTMNDLAAVTDAHVQQETGSGGAYPYGRRGP